MPVYFRASCSGRFLAEFAGTRVWTVAIHSVVDLHRVLSDSLFSDAYFGNMEFFGIVLLLGVAAVTSTLTGARGAQAFRSE